MAHREDGLECALLCHCAGNLCVMRYHDNLCCGCEQERDAYAQGNAGMAVKGLKPVSPSAAHPAAARCGIWK